jgi:hypothetical protein
MLLRELWKNLGPEDSWLLHIDISSIELVSVNGTSNVELLKSSRFIFDWSVESIRFIVGCIALISVGHSRTISLIVVNTVDGAVDWDLIKVDTKSVSLGVGVSEDSALKNSIITWFNAWNQISWREGGLLHFSEKVSRIAVKN